MSGLLACFTCHRKPKKPVRPIVARSPCVESRTSELSGYHRASTLSSIYAPETPGCEGVTKRRQRDGKVVNKPLREYKFPRVESMFEAKVEPSA